MKIRAGWFSQSREKGLSISVYVQMFLSFLERTPAVWQSDAGRKQRQELQVCSLPVWNSRKEPTRLSEFCKSVKR